MLLLVTILEILAGVCSGIGLLEILFFQSNTFALLGAELSATTLLMLFFGQRVAQDYVGATGLVPYFLLVILAVNTFGGKG